MRAAQCNRPIRRGSKRSVQRNGPRRSLDKRVLMAEIRRLAVCLDGTWNNRDDSTNVLHHFALTPECRDKRVDNDRVTQLKLYLEGVGTGPLDAITGGGFGFGLE